MKLLVPTQLSCYHFEEHATQPVHSLQLYIAGIELKTLTRGFGWTGRRVFALKAGEAARDGLITWLALPLFSHQKLIVHVQLIQEC